MESSHTIYDLILLLLITFMNIATYNQYVTAAVGTATFFYVLFRIYYLFKNKGK